MAAPTIVFVFLFFSAAVTIEIINASITLPFDRSAVCSKATQFPNDYPPIGISCCDAGSTCEKFIPPNGTKYGLTNPDAQWQRRLCSCEYKFFLCVMKDIPDNWKSAFSDRLLQDTCFYQSGVHVKGQYRQPVYQWSTLLTAIRCMSGNRDVGLPGSWLPPLPLE